MKVSEAIKVLTQTLHQYEKHLLSGQRDAVKLGVEALKAISLLREGTPGLNLSTLPGESPKEDRHAGDKADTGG